MRCSILITTAFAPNSTRAAGAGRPAVLLALHSFTPVYHGVERPWHAGLLYGRDTRLGRVLLELLRAEPGLNVGDNEPYAVSDRTDYAIPVHGERRGIPHAGLEIRQDLIADADGQAAWAARLAPLLRDCACETAVALTGGRAMQIRVGYELIYQLPQPTPMIVMLSVHYTRASDVIEPDHLTTSPRVPVRGYRDSFGNWCSRIVAPPGRFRLAASGLVNDSGLPDPVVPQAQQHAVDDLPEETLLFLLGSRYCETDRLMATAWDLFGNGPSGWGRVQAVCDFVHRHISFGYEHADFTKTAWQVFNDRQGVCRDFAHLAIALCRCLNIPARYCTGYLGDIGMPPPWGCRTSPPGSKPISAATGTPSTRATTFRASAAC